MNDLLATLAWLIPSVTVITEYISKALKNAFHITIKKYWTVTLSWIISMMLCLGIACYSPSSFGWILPLNTLHLGLAFGIIVGGLANGFFNIKVVQKVLELIKAREKK